MTQEDHVYAAVRQGGGNVNNLILLKPKREVRLLWSHTIRAGGVSCD